MQDRPLHDSERDSEALQNIDSGAPLVDCQTCPECGYAFAPPTEPSPVLDCPSCHAQFFGQAPEDEPDNRLEQEDASEPDAPTEEELSGLRIRQLSALRRGAYRSRSYCIIVWFTLLVATSKLITMTVRHVRNAGWQPRPIGYGLGSIACLIAAVFFYRRILELNRELRKPSLEEPTQPPDFSTLSDGSQHWKNLEQM